MRRVLLIILGLIGYVAACAAQTVLPKPAIDALVAPTLILGQGRYAQAADSFHAQSTQVLTLERKLGTKLMWQVAGLAEGLAAIAAEKNQDPMAYEYWANSVRYFLMSGSSWQALQTQLHQEYEQSNSRLQVSMSPGDSGVAVDNAWLELFSIVEVWQERLDYFYYRQPSADLATQVTQSQQALTGQESQPLPERGAQLRQYVPNNQLNLDSGFTNRQTFEPKASTELPRARSVSPNPANISSQPVVIESSPVVITSPLSPPRAIVEQDHAGEQTGDAQQASSPSSEEVEESSQFRANLDAGSTQGVSATQRRTFTPE
ncbi:hypothetical protein [Vibrio panuliri]|uniref:Uncharacterized protein n=1 Tax=Vibrio panuliri TaxID=1381081 RepID=A0ABX3F7U9_9VIBR|nr:hypothetical protein [Vibrio panuliri]KAB1457128.1 hypothetical protein F7O85_05045 [Vibrio panuliri]OLQ84791.1 hypothetical protein BIY20_16915 [Vibrio panuliri]